MVDFPAAVPSLPQIHGHRGCRGLFPENTLPAFLHALMLGVDVLEMDVIISADQQVVVAHEPWLSARLGLAPTGQPIDPQQERTFNLYQLPYATIRQSALGIAPHPLFPAQQLVPTYRPLLSEVLRTSEEVCRQLGRPPVGYSIEIKSSAATEGHFHPAPETFTKLVLQIIPPAIQARVTLLSFDVRILRVARQVLPSLQVCLLMETFFSPSCLFRELGFVPEFFGPDFQLLTPEILQEIRRCYPALAIVAWTINQPEDIARAIDWQLVGITTDYPNRAIQS